MSRRKAKSESNDSEFLWLVSLSDLMILLFVFFVTLFSFAYQKMSASDFQKMSDVISGKEQATPIDEIQKKLLDWVVQKDLLDSIDVQQKEDSLILQIKEKLLFESGNYLLKGESSDLVSLIGKALNKIPAPYRIGVEGHTDDVPLNSNTYVKDNWELSARRAHSVLSALGLAADQKKRSVLLAYGKMKPLAPNRDKKGKSIPGNQAKNRRVTIRVF